MRLPPAKNNRIFIVEDDDGVRKALTRLFAIEGFNVEGFDSARAFLNSVPPDSRGCLVLDVYMPEMDGFGLQRAMAQLGYRLRIIFISAHAQAGEREYGLERGAAGFLLKPFEDRSILELVRRNI